MISILTGAKNCCSFEVIFDKFSNAVFRFPLRVLGAEIWDAPNQSHLFRPANYSRLPISAFGTPCYQICSNFIDDRGVLQHRDLLVVHTGSPDCISHTWSSAHVVNLHLSETKKIDRIMSILFAYCEHIHADYSGNEQKIAYIIHQFCSIKAPYWIFLFIFYVDAIVL